MVTSKIVQAKRIRLDAAIRRGQIVEAAFEAIANEGFEGLRTRDIASEAGINSATLHHHFPTKEDLVAAVAGRLEQRFRLEKTPPKPGEDALDTLHRQLNDTFSYYQDCPDMLAVYRELVARAPRDPGIQKLVERLHTGWRADVAEILKRGREDGSFPRKLDCNAAANVVLCAIWGMVAQIYPSTNAFRAAIRQITAWLTLKE